MRASTIRSVRRSIAVAAALPIVVSMSGCGSNTSGQTAGDPANPSASHSTAHAKPTKHDISPAKLVALVRSGVADLTTVKVSMSTDVAGQLVTAKGAMDLTGDHPAMQMTMDLTGMGVPTQMRLVDGVMYVQTSSGGMFVKMDLSDPNSPLGDMGSTMGDLDPRSMTSGLSPDMFTKVTDLGSTKVGGQTLEHYRVTADTGASMKMIKGLSGSGVKLPRRVTYDMWLDDHHRMARILIVMKRYMKVTARYYDYGAPVHIVPPPASQITGSTFG